MPRGKQPEEAVEVKTQKTSAPSPPKYFCKARALRNWNCNFNGFEYDFKKDDVIEIKEEWHLEKLTDKHIQAVVPIKGE